MTAAALALVIPSAAAHAGWNLLAKSSGGGLAFIWLGNVVSLAVKIPAAIVATAIAGTDGRDPTRHLAGFGLMAPLRELRILFGVVLGGQFLAEGHTWSRALVALVIVAGVAAVSIG